MDRSIRRFDVDGRLINEAQSISCSAGLTTFTPPRTTSRATQSELRRRCQTAKFGEKGIFPFHARRRETSPFLSVTAIGHVDVTCHLEKRNNRLNLAAELPMMSARASYVSSSYMSMAASDGGAGHIFPGWVDG